MKVKLRLRDLILSKYAKKKNGNTLTLTKFQIQDFIICKVYSIIITSNFAKFENLFINIVKK